MDKQNLRNHFRDIRSQSLLQDETVLQDIQNYVDVLLHGRKGLIGVYSAFDGELDLLPFLEERAQDLCFPKVDGKDISFYHASHNELAPGSFGIKEPSSEKHEKVAPDDMGVLFVPGVAFDKKGGRLGFGRGFYDRYLREFQGLKVGVCHSSQWSEEPLPMESHDVFMDFIISDGCLVQPLKK